MENSSDMFAKFTKAAVSVVEFMTSFVVCFQIYKFSGSWLLGIIAYFALTVVHTLFTYVFFVEELTLDEDKLAKYIEKSMPYYSCLNTVIFMLLYYA